MSGKLSSSVSKLLSAISILWLVSLFSWLFYENFLFTDGYDFLNLTSNDEAIFNYIVHLERTYIAQGEWALFFSNTHAAYGFLYWAVLAITTSPFYDLGLFSIAIAIPKQISLICYFVSLLFFYRLGRFYKISVHIVLLAMVLITTSIAGLFTATMLQTNWPVAALLMVSFYLLEKSPQHKFPLLGVIFFALAVGVKLTAILFFPMFLVFFNKSYKNGIKACLVIFIVSLVSYSPAILAYPFGIHAFERSFYEIKDILLWNSQIHAETRSFWQYISEGYFHRNYHWSILVVASLVAIYQWVRGDSKTAFILLASFCAIAGVALTLHTDSQYVALYSLATIFTIPLGILNLKLPEWRVSMIFLILIGVNYFTHEYYYKAQLVDVHHRYYSPTVQNAIKRYWDIKNKIVLKNTDTVMVDWRMAFPNEMMATPRPITYYYTPDNPGDLIWKESSILAFDTETAGWSSDCDHLVKDLIDEKCIFTQRLKRLGKNYSVIYSSFEALVIRVK